MIFRIQNWTFDIDLAATAEYSAHLLEDHCECGYCRNYYSVIRSEFPSLQCFLNQFGISLEGPVDFLPIEPNVYMVSYAVCGCVLEASDQPIDLGDVSLRVERMSQLDYQLSCKSPYFVFTTDIIELPWVLDEDMKEVISPANEPECLARMWRRVLGNCCDEPIQS